MSPSHCQGVSKGRIVERILHDAAAAGDPPDFVLCIGNDRSGERRYVVHPAASSAQLLGRMLQRALN